MSNYEEAVKITDRLKSYGFNKENMDKLREELEWYNRQQAFLAGFQRAVEIMQCLEEEAWDGTHIEPGILAYEEFEKWEEKNGN